MDEKQIREITRKVIENITNSNSAQIPVGVSGRHVHLCREHMDILFGKNVELKFKKELMGGQFASDECVTIAGPKMRVMAHVRVLGPLRPFSQVEISKTDSFTLGISAPLRDSGDLRDAAAITLIGPMGAVTLPHGCIIARRHIHMSPADAARFGVTDQAVVDVRFNNTRGGVLTNVLVRVDDSFTAEMHIDTDEANGLGIVNGDYGEVIT